jgi:hypothetical protein
MARQGQCHCGTVLKFHRRPWGYKRRCPRCGAVVRLRTHPPGAASPHVRPPGAAPVFDVELVAAGPPTPARVYWSWVAATAALAAAAILALVWFTRR